MSNQKQLQNVHQASIDTERRIAQTVDRETHKAELGEKRDKVALSGERTS